MSFCLTYERDRASSFFPNKVENYKITPMMMIMYFFSFTLQLIFQRLYFTPLILKSVENTFYNGGLMPEPKKKQKKIFINLQKYHYTLNNN